MFSKSRYYCFQKPLGKEQFIINDVIHAAKFTGSGLFKLSHIGASTCLVTSKFPSFFSVRDGSLDVRSRIPLSSKMFRSIKGNFAIKGEELYFDYNFYKITRPISMKNDPSICMSTGELYEGSKLLLTFNHKMLERLRSSMVCPELVLNNMNLTFLRTGYKCDLEIDGRVRVDEKYLYVTSSGESTVLWKSGLATKKLVVQMFEDSKVKINGNNVDRVEKYRNNISYCTTQKKKVL